MRVSHLELLSRRVLVSRDVVSPLHVFRLVVGHSLECVDQVDKLEPAIDIFVKPSDPIDDVCVLDFCGAIIAGQEHSQIVRIDLPVSVLVHHSEDRQYRVVKPADQLLLQ